MNSNYKEASNLEIFGEEENPFKQSAARASGIVIDMIEPERMVDNKEESSIKEKQQRFMKMIKKDIAKLNEIPEVDQSSDNKFRPIFIQESAQNQFVSRCLAEELQSLAKSSQAKSSEESSLDSRSLLVKVIKTRLELLHTENFQIRQETFTRLEKLRKGIREVLRDDYQPNKSLQSEGVDELQLWEEVEKNLGILISSFKNPEKNLKNSKERTNIVLRRSESVQERSDSKSSGLKPIIFYIFVVLVMGGLIISHLMLVQAVNKKSTPSNPSCCQSGNNTQMSLELDQMSSDIQNISKKYDGLAQSLTSLESELKGELDSQRGEILKIQAKLDQHESDFLLPQKRLMSQNFESIPTKSENLHAKVKRLDFSSTSGLIGGSKTFLGFKDQSDFLIGSVDKGIELYQNGEQTHRERLFEKDRNLKLQEIIYSGGDDTITYFLMIDSKIYSKSIQSKEMRVLVSTGNFSQLKGRSLLFSQRKNVLVAVREESKFPTKLYLSAIHLKEQVVVIPINFKDAHTSFLNDMQLLEDEKMIKISAVNEKGQLFLYNYDVEAKSSTILDQYWIRIMYARREQPTLIAVCSKNRYILVAMSADSRASRLVMMEVGGNRFSFLASLDIYDGLNEVYSVEFDRYYGDHVVAFVTLDSSNRVSLYVYDAKNGVLMKKKPQEVVYHGEKSPSRISKLGEKMYYTGELGRLMELTIDNEAT